MNSTGLFSKDAKRSQPFVKILDNKLAIVKEIEGLSPDTRVISILGKARMGKSTFLNVLITNMQAAENETIFTTQDSDEHCTRGIDAFYMPEKNILLLDSQGLAYEDSSHDPQLLLFLYHVSDVVIFNENRRLENGALKLLEPICTFTNYIDMDEVVKPHLFFRIADSDVKEPEKNLEKVLGTYADQYQSIRDSIRHLFHTDIRILPTAPLDKRVRALLNAHEYKEVLSADDLGFQEACQAIEQTVGKAEKKSKLAQLKEVISKINGNEEIKIEKLDIVKLQAEREMTKWRDANVSPALYMPIEVDGTQKSFDYAVKPRKAMKREVLTNFTKRFKAIPETIREPIRSELDDKLGAPIREATTASERKAEERVALPVAVAYSDKTLQQLNSMNNSFCTIPEDFWPNYFHVYEELRHACEDVYQPVKEKHVEWIDSVEAYVRGVIGRICDEEREEAKQFKMLCSQAFDDFDRWAMDEIDKCMKPEWLLLLNHRIIDDNLIHKKFHEITSIGMQLVHRRQLTIHQTGRKVKETIVVDPVPFTEDEFDDYDLVKEPFNELATVLDSGNCKVLKNYLVMKKEELLAGKYLSNLDILSKNPEISFVKDEVNGWGCVFYMTETTFQRTHNILYEKCLKRLLEKGYAKEGVRDMLLKEKDHRKVPSEIRSPEFENVKLIRRAGPQGYANVLMELFAWQLKKEYCKSVVSGFQFPEVLTL